MKTAEQLYKEYMMEINADTEGKIEFLLILNGKKLKGTPQNAKLIRITTE